MDSEVGGKTWDKVNTYLINRHFTEEDIYHGDKLQYQQTSGNMLAASSVKADVKKKINLMSLVSNSDFHNQILNNDGKPQEGPKEDKLENSYLFLAMREFSTFRHYIENGVQPEKLKIELSSILYPLFCKFYIFLIERYDQNYDVYIRNFIKRNEDLFPNHVFGVKLKREMLQIHKKKDFYDKPLTNYFRSKRWNIELSQSSIYFLKLFMKKREYSMILADAFNMWFNFDQTSIIMEDDGEKDLQKKEDFATSEPISKEEEAMTEKEECFKKLLEGYRDKLSWSSCLSMYELHNCELASCSTVSLSRGILACGTLRSDIKLWNISGKEAFVNKSTSHTIKLNGMRNYNYTEEDDENLEREEKFVTLRGHYGPISKLVILNDANMLLSASEDKCMRAWNLETGICSCIYKGHSKPLTSLDINSLNMFVATGSMDNTAKLWMLDRISTVRMYAGHIAPVTCVRFHPNGAFLATGSVDKTIRMFEVLNGAIIRVFVGHTGSVYCIEFSSDGLLLASGGDDNDVRIWEVSTSQELLKINVPSIPVSYLQWDLSCSYLFVTLLENYISVWKIESNGTNAEEVFDFDKPQHRFTSCEYFPDRNTLACVAIKSKEKIKSNDYGKDINSVIKIYSRQKS